MTLTSRTKAELYFATLAILAPVNGLSFASEPIPTFGAPLVYQLDGGAAPMLRPWGIAVGDVVGTTAGSAPDGFSDVVVVAAACDLHINLVFVSSNATPSLWLFRNQGNNALGQWQGLSGPTLIHSFAAGRYPREVKIAQLTDDINPDLVVTLGYARDAAGQTVSTQYGIFVFKGNGNGTFGTPDPFATEMPVGGFSIAHMNADEYLDIVTATDTFLRPANLDSDKVYVHYSDSAGLGDFSDTYEIDLGLGNDQVSGDVVTGNFRTQGGAGMRVDFVTANVDGPSISLGSNFGYRNITIGNQSPPVGCGVPWSDFWSLATATFTDGKLIPDVAGVMGCDVNVLHGHPSGTFGYDCNGTDRYALYTNCDRADEVEDIAAGNINGGVRADVVVTGAANNAVFFLLGKGNGKLQFGGPLDLNYQVPVSTAQYAKPTQVLVADMNNDGFGDIVTSHLGAAGNDPANTPDTISVVLNAISFVPPG